MKSKVYLRLLRLECGHVQRWVSCLLGAVSELSSPAKSKLASYDRLECIREFIAVVVVALLPLIREAVWLFDGLVWPLVPLLSPPRLNRLLLVHSWALFPLIFRRGTDECCMPALTALSNFSMRSWIELLVVVVVDDDIDSELSPFCWFIIDFRLLLFRFCYWYANNLNLKRHLFEFFIYRILFLLIRVKYKIVFFLLKWNISALFFYSSLIYTILSLVNHHLLNYTLVNIFSNCWFIYSYIYSFIV